MYLSKESKYIPVRTAVSPIEELKQEEMNKHEAKWLMSEQRLVRLRN